MKMKTEHHAGKVLGHLQANRPTKLISWSLTE